MKISCFLLSWMLLSSSVFAAPVVDGSSSKSFMHSIGVIGADYDKQKKEMLVYSVQLLADQLSGEAALAAHMSGADGQEVLFNLLGEWLDGLTGDGVFKVAKEIVDEELTSVEDGVVSALADQDRLNALVIDKISYAFSGKDFNGNPKVVVTATVTNKTSKPLSAIYFMCQLKSPDRQVPWLKEKVIHKIAGGIEVGETLTLSMEPNPFDWEGTGSIREDSVISASIYRVDDAHNRKLWELSPDALNELSKLKELVQLSKKLAGAISG